MESSASESCTVSRTSSVEGDATGVATASLEGNLALKNISELKYLSEMNSSSGSSASNSDAWPMRSCCSYCNLSLLGTSLRRSSKRKYSNMLLEDILGCSSELSGDEILGSNVSDGAIEIEGPSSKVFPEDILGYPFKSNEQCTERFSEQPNDNVQRDKNLKVCREVEDTLREEPEDVLLFRLSATKEGTYQPVAASENYSQQLAIASDDVALKPERCVDIQFSDNLSPQGKEEQVLQGVVLEQNISRSSSDCDETSMDVHSKRKDVEHSDATPYSGQLFLEGWYDADELRQALKAEQEALNAVYLELEQERNASEIAANEAMAMISRLQKEKAILQMEARHFERMSEERATHDQEAIAVLKDILMKREAEKLALEKEVELYRQRLLSHRIEGLDSSRREWGVDRKDFALEGKKEPVLLLKGKEEESESSRRGQVDTSLTSAGVASAPDDIGADCHLERIEECFQRTSLWSGDGANLFESFLAVADGGPSLYEQEDICKSRSLVSTSHMSLAEVVAETAGKNNGGGIHIHDSSLTSGQWNQTKAFGDSDHCGIDYHLTPGAPVTSKLDKNTAEDKTPRSSGDVRWQFVLDHLCNLENQIRQLKTKEKFEIENQCKEETVCRGDRESINSERKSMGHSCDWERGSVDAKQGCSLSERGTAGDQTVRKKVPGEHLSEDSLKISSENEINQLNGGTVKGFLSGQCSISILQQNGEPFIDHPKVSGLWCKGRYRHEHSCHIPAMEDLEIRTTRDWPKLTKRDASVEPCSIMPEPESSSRGAERTNVEVENPQCSLETSDALLLATTPEFSCTESMNNHSNFSMAVENDDVRRLTSKLQALEADNELMRSAIKAMVQERGKVDLLQELVQLYSFKSDDWQQQQTVLCHHLLH
eukprot:c29157_g1_i2 orf=283-2943(-)